MDSKSVKKGLFLVTMTGALLVPTQTTLAKEGKNLHLPEVGIETVLDEKKGEYLDMVFADVESFLYVRSEPTKDSDWVGKLYPEYAAKITGPVGEWTPIESGSVKGYVKTEYILTGNAAASKAEELLREKTEETAAIRTAGKAISVDAETAFKYAESKEAEEQRLRAEAKERAKRLKKSGQAVVDYACQFIGNPYVWGGTSLTNGADCSGFVQAVYANFGVKMPRTSAQMRSVGRGVRYDEIIPGDVICYEGHVGIYAGDGKIINALNKRKGIVLSSATYKNIITVRRLL